MRKHLFKRVIVSILAIVLVVSSSGMGSLAATNNDRVRESEEIEIEEISDSVGTFDNDYEAVSEDNDGAVQFAGGSGTEEDPYQISSAEQLNEIRNNLDAKYILVNDIDLSIIDSWEPIGQGEYGSFKGTLDGQGYKIKNLLIKSPISDSNVYIGLFGCVGTGCVIKNCEIVNAKIDIDYQVAPNSLYCGVLVAYNSQFQPGITITNCKVYGDIKIITHNDHTDTYSRMITVGGIYGSSNGRDEANGTISECEYNGSINIMADDSKSCGGICGRDGHFEIVGCKTQGEITISSLGGSGTTATGGICGGAEWSTSSINDCENYCDINVTENNNGGVSTIAGIIGHGSKSVNNCINYGEIGVVLTKSSGNIYAGGIGGAAGSISNSINYGGKIDAKYVTIARICPMAQRLENNYSIESVLLNEEKPSDKIGLNEANGLTFKKGEEPWNTTAKDLSDSEIISALVECSKIAYNIYMDPPTDYVDKTQTKMLPYSYSDRNWEFWKVVYPEWNSVEGLKTYIKKYFTESCIEGLMKGHDWTDTNDGLYVSATDGIGSFEEDHVDVDITKVSDTEYKLNLKGSQNGIVISNYTVSYKLIDENWVFDNYEPLLIAYKNIDNGEIPEPDPEQEEEKLPDFSNFNYNTYRADYLINNADANEKVYSVINEYTPCEEIADNTGLVRASMIEWARSGMGFGYIKDPKTLVEYQITGRDLYFAAIMDIIKKSEEDSLVDTYNDTRGTADKWFSEIKNSDDSYDYITKFTKIASLSSEDQEEYIRIVKKVIGNDKSWQLKVDDLKEDGRSKVLSYVDDAFRAAETIGDAYDSIQNILTLYYLNNESKDALYDLYEFVKKTNGNDTSYLGALEWAIACMDIDPSETIQIVVGRYGAEYVWDTIWDDVIFAACKKCSASFSIVMMAYDIGNYSSKLISNYDAIADKMLNCIIMADIVESINALCSISISSYKNSPSEEKAVSMLTLVKMMLRAHIVDRDYAISYCKACDGSSAGEEGLNGIGNKVFTAVFPETSHSKAIESLLVQKDEINIKAQLLMTLWYTELANTHPNSGLLEYYNLEIKKAIARVKNKVYTFACPVDVVVDSPLGSSFVRNGRVHAEEDVVIVLNGDKKTVYLTSEDNCKISLYGTDTGTMNASVSTLENGRYKKTKVYYDVPLTNTLVYSMDACNDSESASTIDMLMIGNTSKEVDKNEPQKVTLSVLNGYIDNPDNIDVTSGCYYIGDVVCLVANEIPGKIFTGWSINGDSVISDANSQYTAVTIGRNNSTITANYRVASQTHTIRILKGDHGSVLPAEEIVVTDKDDLELYIIPDDGYKISKLIVDGEEVASTSAFLLNSVEADHVVEVEFLPSEGKNRVTFCIGKEGFDDIVQEVNTGELISKPKDPQIDGCIFEGWYIDKQCRSEWDFAKNKVQEDIILYAKLTLSTCNIFFDSRGGEYVDIVLVDRGTIAKQPIDPTRDGYTFIGWYKDEDLTSQWNFATDTVTDSMILYAKWRINGVTEEPLNSETAVMLAVKEKYDISNYMDEPYDKYAIDNTKLATVTKKGLITAKKPGTVTVTGYKKSGRNWIEGESAVVQIVKPFFAKKTIDARFDGQILRLYDYLVDHSYKTPDEIISSNEKVAFLTGEKKNTIIHIHGKGTAKITVKYGEGKNAAKYSITVKASFPTMSKANLKIQTGQSAVLALKNTKLIPEWDGGGLVTIDDAGKFTAISAGEGVISATVEGVIYSCNIKVVEPVIKKKAISVKVGGTGAVGLKNTKLKNIEWVSDDTSIATVDEKGRVKGISKGTTTIRTFAGNVENSCTVTVK